MSGWSSGFPEAEILCEVPFALSVSELMLQRAALHWAQSLSSPGSFYSFFWIIPQTLKRRRRWFMWRTLHHLVRECELSALVVCGKVPEDFNASFLEKMKIISRWQHKNKFSYWCLFFFFLARQSSLSVLSSECLATTICSLRITC